MSLLFPQPISLVIPIRPGVAITMTVPRQLSDDDWQQFHRVLEAMMPALVKTDAQADQARSG